MCKKALHRFFCLLIPMDDFFEKAQFFYCHFVPVSLLLTLRTSLVIVGS